MKQESFSDMEYRCRKKKTKREEFLEIMDEIIPWEEWVSLIVPHYPTGKRGRPPIEIEIMLRMYLLQCWFNLSDEGVETVISLLLTMGERSVGKELMGWFKLKGQTPSASAFVQQRQKLLPSAMEALFHRFTARLRPVKTFRGYRLLAVDGSDLKSASWPGDPASYRPRTDCQHGWNLWHMDVLFDLENGVYTDLIVQKEHEKNERKVLCQMVDRSSISRKVILLADRNYEACNDLAHLERKGWNYLIRIRDKNRTVAYGVKLPDQPSFDIPVHITLGRLTNRQLEARSLAVPEPYYRLPPGMTFDFLPLDSLEFYQLSFRIVRLERDDGTMISFLTNLPQDCQRQSEIVDFRRNEM